MSNASVATVVGRTIIWRRMTGNGSEPKNIKWGTSAVTASAATDVALFTPATETGVAGTSTIINNGSPAWVLGDTYQVTGTLTCLVTSKTITEMILSDTTTLSGTTTIATSSQSAGATTITLTAGANLPTAGNFYIQTENEVQLVTAGQNSNTFTVTRGALSSTSAAHAIGVAVTCGGDGGASAVGLGGQTATVGAAQGGNTFCHADFAGIALNVNDSILFTVKDQLT
jgi:hypothetical protein